MRFVDRVALVTGAGSGIGEAVAHRLAEEGAAVIVADIDEGKAAAVAAGLGGRALPVRLDVADWKSVEAAVTVAADTFGRLNILVNNAGIAVLGKVTGLALDDWRKVMSVTLDGVFQCCKAAIPLMAKTGGSIVNIGSTSGMAGDYGMPVYNAAKGAVVNFTRSLAIDHIGEGIRVNCISPGMVATPASAMLRDNVALWDKLMTAYPRRQAASPQEIAAVVAFLASDDAAAMVGANVVADGGMTAWSGMPSFE